MTEIAQRELGKTLWSIADQLRGAMNADDFRDYMLSYLFLRYLSDNYEAAAKKELGSDYPKLVTWRRLIGSWSISRKRSARQRKNTMRS
jgi:type I restriction enzyme M protein